MPPWRTWLTFPLILLANFVLMQLLFAPGKPAKVPYTLFKHEVAARG
jgi:hypothetical protein